MRRSYVFYVIACVMAALAPFIFAESRASSSAGNVAFGGWPTQFEGKTLTALPLTDVEKRFASDFPGRIGRFTDGNREIIIRWVTEATRKLHPSSDCFQGLGYTVKPLAAHRGANGSLWASFAATKDNNRLLVYERINNDSGATWTDVSSWYWSALRHEDSGPWWAFTVAEKQPQPEK
jgi:hypothetical protein